jgi:hypothetical protein
MFRMTIKKSLSKTKKDARQDNKEVARQDKKRMLGRTGGDKRGIATLRVASARQQKMSFSNTE